MLGRMTVMRISKQNSDLQLAYQNHDTRNFQLKKENDCKV